MGVSINSLYQIIDDLGRKIEYLTAVAGQLPVNERMALMRWDLVKDAIRAMERRLFEEHGTLDANLMTLTDSCAQTADVLDWLSSLRAAVDDNEAAQNGGQAKEGGEGE